MKTFFGFCMVFVAGAMFDHCYVAHPGALTKDATAAQQSLSQGAKDAQNRYEQEQAAAHRTP